VKILYKAFYSAALVGSLLATQAASKKNKKSATPKNDGKYNEFAIYETTAPKAKKTTAVDTTLPLVLEKNKRIMFIGNTLLEREGDYAYFEAMLHSQFKKHELSIRNLAWSADEVTIQPRPGNFANLEQHLTVFKADIIFAAFGFNESFKGQAGLEQFKKDLANYIQELKTTAFNGRTAPKIILVSPIANENITGVTAATANNQNIKLYADAMQTVALKQRIGFVNVYDATLKAMQASDDITSNGVHMLEEGYKIFAKTLFEQTFKKNAPEVNEEIRQVALDKNRQFFRRYRPLNTFYYMGGRSSKYGYLDFLPAMQSFDVMSANRDQHMWRLSQNKPSKINDSNVPEMPKSTQSRGANEWMTAEDEYKNFDIDPRFEVNLFASEDDFPELACPIHMKWDNRGRLWVSCSTTYPHIYPGQEHNDKLIILEDTDNDGKADKCTTFADNLHIPLAFEFGDGGVYVSDQPNLLFIKDTNGDGKADFRRTIFSGFGTEDSHHSLHDFVRTPDGDLMFRESIFHNSQVETAYGPVRAKNSAWFQYHPSTHKLSSFGNYPNTNPWGVTFDDWGFHVASHPNFASSFHATNPPYPQQHPGAMGMDAYSGTCGQEFVDFDTFPKELQGGYIKARYKPSNRIEIHQWNEKEGHFKEKLVTNLLFAKNLSFIPVDIRFGPRGALYICDWYNPVKGHAQYSLRDKRRDRKAGRIWRVTTKGKALQEPVKISGESLPNLLNLLKRKEYRIRYWAKSELMERDANKVDQALKKWLTTLDKNDSRYRHHQTEAMWLSRAIDKNNTALIEELMQCEIHYARAAAVRQLRYSFKSIAQADALLLKASKDENGLVRLEASITASYIGGKSSLEAIRNVIAQPRDAHINYAAMTALGSETLLKHWQPKTDADLDHFITSTLKASTLEHGLRARNSSSAQFDADPKLTIARIECTEQLTFTKTEIRVKAGEPLKIELINPSATQHNLVIVTPGSAQKVGTAANEMAKSPDGAKKHFVPRMSEVLYNTPLVKANSSFALRIKAPEKPGKYPYICTFPGHWIIMKGVIIVE
jgi:azurin